MAKKINNEQIAEVLLQNTAEFLKTIESNKTYLNGLNNSINVATKGVLEKMNDLMITPLKVNYSPIENSIDLLEEEFVKQRTQQSEFLSDFESKIKRGVNVPFWIKLSVLILVIASGLSSYYNYTFYDEVKSLEEKETLFMEYINSDKTGLDNWYRWLNKRT